MHLFLSAGEPSGDLHAANLIRELGRQQPEVRITGMGGEHMTRAGAELIYPLAETALIGFGRVLTSVPRFARILRQADQFFRDQRPDAVVLLDYPGFHFWLASKARARNIPVIYHCPPQLWAWRSYRVRTMRRLVQRVLCTFAFEEEWYRQRGVSAQFIGHPYFDELQHQQLDSAFLDAQRSQPGEIVAILPGSRSQELELNVESLFRAAALIHARKPDVRFLVACLRSEQADWVRAHLPTDSPPSRFPGAPLPPRVEIHAGRTAEIIHLAHSCLSVSGSVGLELLYRGKPSVVTYRLPLLYRILKPLLLNCPYVSLVNLLADKELFPEVVSLRCPPEALAEPILRWLQDPAAYNALCGELANLRERVAQPGASERAAKAVLGYLNSEVRCAA